MPKFGDVLKRLREQSGMSQVKLGEKAGITQEAISRYESKGQEPNWESAVALAAALGVSLDVFREDLENVAMPKRVRVMVEIINDDGTSKTLIDETTPLTNS
jgi:transcriptional regulator with XRE-family HTH domain